MPEILSLPGKEALIIFSTKMGRRGEEGMEEEGGFLRQEEGGKEGLTVKKITA